VCTYLGIDATWVNGLHPVHKLTKGKHCLTLEIHSFQRRRSFAGKDFMLTTVELTDARERLRQAKAHVAGVRDLFLSGGDTSGGRLLNEVVHTLEEPLGAVHDWRDKMPWHFGDGLFVDRRPFGEIIGGRLKEAREALGMDVATFYAPAGMTDKTAKKWEAGKIADRFHAFGERQNLVPARGFECSTRPGPPLPRTNAN
jgi:hypothetical protein